MKRNKRLRLRAILLPMAFLMAMFIGLSVTSSPALAASLGQCQFTDASTISSCNGGLTGFTFKGSGTSFTFLQTCHPGREFGSDNYTVTVGTKLSTGGYNATIATTHSGISCGNQALNGSLTITDPNGVGPNGGSNGNGGNTGPNGGVSSPTCTTTGDPMSWVLCPIFNGVADMSDWMLNSVVTPFLITTPISTNPSDPTYKTWSNFRLYGNLVLITALLIIIIGESIGVNLFDAYTVKKALPRILAATILLNISIYLAAFAVDVTNIIGKSIGDVLIAPFKNAGNWSFSPNGAQGIGVLSIGLLGFFIYKSHILQTLSSIFGPAKGSQGAAALSKVAGQGSFLRVALWAGLMVAIPMMLAILAVFVTLIIRKGAILFLILVAPFAFALYALPNTEGWFGRWWKTLAEFLLAYPIIIIIFAVADILSITILNANGIHGDTFGSAITSGSASILAIIIAFVLQFIWLFLVPFSIRIAGGAIGKLHEGVAGFHGKAAQSAGYKHAREHAAQAVGDQKLLAAERMRMGFDERSERQNTGTFWGRRRAGFWKKASYWGAPAHTEQRISAMNKREAEARAEATGYGPDDSRRASTINWDRVTAAKRGGAEALRRMGLVEGEDFRVNQGGGVELASLGGKFYGLATAERAHKEFAGNTSALQENMTYEMTKATTAAEKTRILNQYGGWARSNGWDANEANERWIGSAYGNQNKDKNFKYYRYDAETGRLGALNALGQVTEMNREQGQWEWGKFSAQTYNDLSRNVSMAADVLGGRVSNAEIASGAAGMFTHDAAGTVGAMTAQEKAQAYLQEVGKHVHFLESPGQAVDPNTGQAVSGGGRQVLYGAAPETSQAAQGLVNTFHNRGGQWISRLDQEAESLPQAQRTFVGNTTEQQVSGVGGPSAGQVQRNEANRTAENPGGLPERAAPAHIYPNPRDAGVLTGTGQGRNSYILQDGDDGQGGQGGLAGGQATSSSGLITGQPIPPGGRPSGLRGPGNRGPGNPGPRGRGPGRV